MVKGRGTERKEICQSLVVTKLTDKTRATMMFTSFGTLALDV